MNELQLIEKLGMVTLPDIQNNLDKSPRTIFRQLNQLEKREEIVKVQFSMGQFKRSVYFENKIYCDLFQIHR